MPDLVPSPLFGKSCYRLLPNSQWRKLRKRVIDERGSACEICGNQPDKGLTCHEQWAYDDEHLTATLVGFEMCCRLCSLCHHPGFAGVAIGAQALRDVEQHTMRVNGMTLAEVRDLHRAAFAEWRRRSRDGWTQSIAPGLVTRHPELVLLPFAEATPDS